MAPRTILLMRHAEKPDDPDDPDDPYLSDAGRDRAARLAEFIPAKYGKPDFVFTAAESEKSMRSCLTMKPLGAAIAVPLDSRTRAKDCRTLATKLLSVDLYASKLVVACWSHDQLPRLAAALYAPPGDIPDPWDPSVFDLVLQLDYDNDSPPVVTRVNEPFLTNGCDLCLTAHRRCAERSLS